MGEKKKTTKIYEKKTVELLLYQTLFVRFYCHTWHRISSTPHKNQNLHFIISISHAPLPRFSYRAFLAHSRFLSSLLLLLLALNQSQFSRQSDKQYY